MKILSSHHRPEDLPSHGRSAFEVGRAPLMRFLTTPSAHAGRDAIYSPESGHAFEIIPLRRLPLPGPAPFADLPLEQLALAVFACTRRRVIASRFNFARLLARASDEAVLLGAGDGVFDIRSFSAYRVMRRHRESVRQTLRRLRSTVRAPSENPIGHAHGRFLPRRAPPLYLMPVFASAGPCRRVLRAAMLGSDPRDADLRDLVEPSGLPSTFPRLDSAHGVSNLLACPSQVCSR